MNRGQALGALVLAAGLVVAGCSGGDNRTVKASNATTTASSTTLTTTAAPLTTTSTRPATTTTKIPPGTVVVHPPLTTTAPVTTTSRPPVSTTTTSQAPASTTTTSRPPASTTTTKPNSPAKRQAEILRQKLLTKLGPSNRDVPDAARFTVAYTPGQEVVVTWSINNGAAPLPTGTPTCTPIPATSAPSTPSPSATTKATSSTTRPRAGTTTTTIDPSKLDTKTLARYEAHQIIVTTKSRLSHLNITHLRLVGQYPLSAPTDEKVIDVTYPHATVQTPKFDYPNAFEAPPAQTITCIDPVFK